MGINELIRVGDTLKSYRLKSGLTQAEFADELKIPRTTYANYENNLRVPNGDILRKIANIYEVKVRDILEDAISTVDARLDFGENISSNDRENPLITISDVLNSFVNLTEIIRFGVEVIPDNGCVTKDDGTRKILPGVNYSAFTSLTFSTNEQSSPIEQILSTFILEWKEKYDLYKTGTIDKEMYDLWIDKKIKSYSEYSYLDSKDGSFTICPF